MTDHMCYVAVDPEQPGAAYAICVDDPDYPKDTANFVAREIRKGANVLRVDRSTGVGMIDKWVRKQKDLL